MLKIYSYVVDHDLGLAPNPFNGYCTLAVCKGSIRRSSNLNVGDWIIGTGSRALEKVTGKKYIHKLIYAMQLEEIMPLENYWNDERFSIKKPMLNGSLVAMYGDNFYHKNANGEWIQENSAHSFADGRPNPAHIEKDTRGVNVLISRNFYYFGDSAPLIPQEIMDVCHEGVGQKIVDEDLNAEFLSWLTKNYVPGIYGDPANWTIYNQTSFPI